MTQFLFDNIVLVLTALFSGALLAFPGLLKQLSIPELSTFAATQLINGQKAVLIDLRDDKARAKGHIPNARILSPQAVSEQAQALTQELMPAGKPVRPVILVCAKGLSHSSAGRALRKAGHPEVFGLEGGFEAWAKAGLPVTGAQS